MNNHTDIVILGAGYGGLSCATRLSRHFRRRADVRIHLVDRHTYHLLETRLHERAVREEEVTIPIARILRKRRNVTFHLGEVTNIDVRAREVELDFGRTATTPASPRTLRYDYLVIALGSKTNFYQIPGLEEHAFQLKEFNDSERIREHTERMFAIAATESNANRRREYLRFVIGGGGLTGVELATEMVERFDDLAAQYHLDPQEAEMVLVERAERVLPALGSGQVERSVEAMQAMGIRIITGTRITGMKEVDGRMLLLREPGEPVLARTVIWTGGIRISDLLRRSGVGTGANGRVTVDPYLQLTGYAGMFAIGDNALAINPDTDSAVPTAAQFALQQGYTTADNLHRLMTGRPMQPYRPRVLGEVVSLGRHLAVGWTALPLGGNIRFLGFLGSLLKRAIAEKHLFLLWKERQNWDMHW